MADEPKLPKEGEESKDEVIAKLTGQIDNLNKGIATYRDEAKSAKEEAAKASQTATQALQRVAEMEKLSQKKDEGVALTADEEKKLAAYAQKTGLVSKADLEAERTKQFGETVKAYENQAVEEFLEKHPGYDSDEKWKEVMTEFALYRQPTTKQGYSALLERIHKDLSGDAQKDAAAKARADIINRNKLGLGGGSQKGGEDEAEAELERLTKKYPNLSRDQIVERLVDLKKLPTKK